MDYFTIKTIFAVAFVIIGFTAAFSMLTLMGKAEKRMNPVTLRKIHKISGFLFAFLLLFLSLIGAYHWINTGDLLSVRAAFHVVLALSLFIVFALKILIVRFFKQFLKTVPTLGMTVFVLVFIVANLSAGFYLARSIFVNPNPGLESQPAWEVRGSEINGKSLFSNICGSCHYADKEILLKGPGLKGILKKDVLPSSKRPATEANIKLQLLQPYLIMPSFDNLSEQETADIIEYLKTL